jgi:starch-binding outer membrane protein, SusD/RagB family
MASRGTILTALPSLQKYEPSSGRPKIGLAFALVAYIELLVAENYCAGLPLATPTSTGVSYGMPLSTDSLLGVAESHFDSSLAYAGADPVVGPLASVGLGRARLDRANYTGAAMAVSGVATSFVYNITLQPGGYNNFGFTESNYWNFALTEQRCLVATPVDRKGVNGLPYISAHDARLVFDSTLTETCDGAYVGFPDSVAYYPVKVGNPSSNIALATGVEARLIEAEAALHAGQVNTWTTDLNALRSTVPMADLTADSTTTASADRQVDVMFRERAFWMWGTASRLGDMRRLVRQYGRDPGTVFAVGTFPDGTTATLPAPIPSYGTDVNLTLPTGAGGLSDPNPNYKGCISKSA